MSFLTYRRSNHWRIPASLTMMNDGEFYVAAGRGLSLTVSGNEITDATRAAALAWLTNQLGGCTDGASVPAGFGIWDSGTNLFRRGQCDATTDWHQTATGETITTDATTPAPFSPQSIKAVCDGTTAAQGFQAFSATGQAAATGVVGAGSLYFKGVVGAAYTVRMHWLNTDTSTTDGTNLNFTATGAWQLLTPPSLAVAAGKTGDRLEIDVFINGTRAETIWAAHAMLEKLPGTSRVNVSPYIATSGGSTASRSSALVTAPTSLLSVTQGWMAIRVRMGWPSTNVQSSTFMSLDDGTLNNRISLTRTGSWQTRRVVGGVGGSVASIGSDSWNIGDTQTLILRWDAASVALSIGGAFTSVANAGGAFAPTELQIGGGGGALQCGCQALWFACGTGTLTDADAANLALLPNTLTPMAITPDTATCLWPAATVTAYQLR